MEITPSYKQTELGVLPADWDVESFDDVFKRVNAKQYQVLSSSYLRSGSFPVVDQGKKAVVGFSDQVERRFSCPEGGVVVFGDHTCIVKFVIFDFMVGADGTQLLTAKTGQCTQFHAYSLERRGVASTGYNRHFKFLRERLFERPPVEEQKAIAAALSDVDALLAGLDRLIAKKRDLKQAAMQQLLTGQTRLPGFQGYWEVTRLSSVGICLRGVTYSGDTDLSAHDTAATKRLLRSNNVQAANVVTTDVQYVSAARVSERQILVRGDILVCMANGSKSLVGKAGRFDVNDGYEYTFGAFMACFRTSATDANSNFVFYLFQTGRYRVFVNDLLAGSSINNLKPSSIESLEFAFPTQPEQAAIATVLSEMDAELTALEARRDKTRALKQGMMQELLTGRTRLIAGGATHA